MRPELAAAFVAPFVAGLFGLVPLMVQIATTRAQRRDRMTRLNRLRAELEFLKELDALQGKVSARDEAAKPRTNRDISNALRNLLYQYNELSENAPSAAAGGKPPPPRRLSFFQRAFLLYNPQTTSGWILHTLFYMIGFLFLFVAVGEIIVTILNRDLGGFLSAEAITVVSLGIPLLIIQRFARSNATHHAAQLEEPNA